LDHLYLLWAKLEIAVTVLDEASESERIAMAMQSIVDAIRVLHAVDPVLLLNHARELKDVLRVIDDLVIQTAEVMRRYYD
jgi:hypothetical protein